MTCGSRSRATRVGLAAEPALVLRVLAQRRGQQLERHVAVAAGVVGAVDLAHPAPADEGQELVPTDPLHPAAPGCSGLPVTWAMMLHRA